MIAESSVSPYKLGHNFRDLELRKKAAHYLGVLRGLSTPGQRFKAATLGGDPEKSFEQAFASLAFQYVKDKAPRLLDHLIGFQLVDRNEDNTRAMGIFGFRLGNQYLYAPSFFLNGDLKGHELLYMKDRDQFVPLKENWINYLLAKKPHILGEQTPESVRSLGVLQPDIRSLSVPPFYSKYSSAGWKDWAIEFLPAFGDLTTQSPLRMEKYAGLDSRLTLPEILKSSLRLCQLTKWACDRYPEIDRLCRKYYGPDFLKNAVLHLKRKYKEAQAALPPGLEDVSVLRGRYPVKESAGPPVEIRMLDDVTITENDDHIDSEISDSERERLYRDGYLVRDYRKGDEVSETYDTQRKMELANPDASGLYDLLVKPGTFEELLIVNEPHTSRGRLDGTTIVRKQPRNWVNTHRTKIWVKPQTRNREDQQDWIDGIQGTKTLEEGRAYMAVSRSYAGNLEGSAPFVVRDNLGDGRYRVTWMDSVEQGAPTVLRKHKMTYEGWGPTDNYISGNWGRDEELKGDADLIHLSDREGSRFKSMQGTLLVPKDAKVINLEEPRKSDEESVEGEPWYPIKHQSKTRPIEPGDWGDIQLQIIQKTAELKLYGNGDQVSINAGPLVSKKQALFELVRDYGFREKTAKQMILDAERSTRRGKPFEARVKYAQGYPMLGPGPSAPAIPEPQYGYDATYGGYPTQYQQTDFETVPELSPSLTDQSVYDPRPEFMPDPMAMQAAQQAGQMGQKEVFDTSMIASMLRTVRQDSMVDRWTGDLMKALDRLGRILFLFYWHNDEFLDRYGKADLPELEDTLRNAFEVVGDLLLFLKEKDVDPLPGMELSSPDVQEAAG